MFNRLTGLLVVTMTCLCCISESAEMVSVRTKMVPGVDTTIKMPLEELSEGHYRLIIPKEEIAKDALVVDITPDFARAKTGEDGYFVSPRGLIGFFRATKAWWSAPFMIPIFGMQTPGMTYVGHVKGMRYEALFVIDVIDGVYHQRVRYNISAMQSDPYEDIEIEYITLKGKDANYSGMGRWYRNYQLKSGVVKPITERIASGESKHLDYLANALMLRSTHFASKLWKPKERVDYTAENEPPAKVHLKFEQFAPLMQKLKDAGIDQVSVCAAGWQTGGYDGRCPASFPVEPAAGGEEALKKMIRDVQEMGFQIDGHSNYTDCYTCSPWWDETIACKKIDGEIYRNGVWAGGWAMNLCPRNAWETFYQVDMPKIGALGFQGAHYIDVFSATYPYRCADKRHPCNRKEAGEYHVKMLKMARKATGGAASECGWDHCIGELDYINYTSRDMLTLSKNDWKHPVVDRVVPLWEIVYHGIVLYNPDKITQGIINKENQIRLVEFGGRPIIYGFSEKSIPGLKRMYDLYKPLRHLQRVFMDEHVVLQKGTKMQDGVTLTKFSNGTSIVCNYTDKPFDFEGKAIPAMDFKVFE
ncbi:MAG: hypothetical protein GX561_08745 [Lentisphaerae bacterium]|jgi:hypothetical protein|nr:hypothetical protein [Lentisphaerota bacterium]